MARNELWVSAYAVCDDGSENKLFEKKDGKTSYFVPKETMKEYERKISDRLSKDISRTVSANPEKYFYGWTVDDFRIIFRKSYI